MRARKTIFCGVLGALTNRFSSERCSDDNSSASLGLAMQHSMAQGSSIRQVYYETLHQYILAKDSVITYQ